MSNSNNNTEENTVELLNYDNIPLSVRKFLTSKECKPEQREWICSLPWKVDKVPEIDMKAAWTILEKSHYGLEEVKQRILEYISLQKHLGSSYGTVLLLAGPPGVGKTSICKAIAHSLKRELVKVPLDGIIASHEIKGVDKTYKSAQPGVIIRALRRSGTLCPVILLDEIDKMGESRDHGNPEAALLEALDTDRSRFLDNFIEVPVDLSNVVFIATANDISKLSGPLLDRMDIIELNGYSLEDKIRIARDYIIPDEMKNHKLSNDMLQITDNALQVMIEQYASEPGVRKLRSLVKTICRKAVYNYVIGSHEKLTVDKNTLLALFGRSHAVEVSLSGEPEIGVINALGVTNSRTGVSFPVEVGAIPGDGDVIYTGGLQDEVTESCEVAMSVICMNGEKLGLSSDVFDTKDIHVHALMPSIKKTGTSMGLGLYCALVSALLNIPIRGDAAITGEITLRGKVMPVGGINEKIAAAYKTGIKTVLIPAGNRFELEDISPSIRRSVNIILISDVDEAISKALVWPE